MFDPPVLVSAFVCILLIFLFLYFCLLLDVELLFVRYKSHICQKTVINFWVVAGGIIIGGRACRGV